MRSHAHALSHAPSGTSLPSAPECTFDDGTTFSGLKGIAHSESPAIVVEATAPATDGPKNRYERLENRISSSSLTDILFLQFMLFDFDR